MEKYEVRRTWGLRAEPRSFWSGKSHCPEAYSAPDFNNNNNNNNTKFEYL